MIDTPLVTYNPLSESEGLEIKYNIISLKVQTFSITDVRTENVMLSDCQSV